MAREKKQHRATIHDVARHASVSAATVSKVVRGVSSVKKGNVESVQASIEVLGYRMDPLASGLRNENRRIIGVVVPDLSSPFFGALVTWLERAAEEAGYHMIVASSRESEEREVDLVARMNDWRVSGTVLVPVRSEKGRGAETMRALEMRAVLVDRVSFDGWYDTVTADNRDASAAVSDFLLELGCRHVLVYGSTRISKAIRTRMAGFIDQAYAVEPGVKIDTLVSDGDPESQRRAIRKYFDALPSDGGPTGIFSLSQSCTLLVLSELRRLGVSVPDQMALVGFDDAEWMQTAWPTITAVAQPLEAIADKAMSVLLDRIEGRNDGPPEMFLESCRMIIRESTGHDEEGILGGPRATCEF